MPFNGAGVFSSPGADFPAVTQTVISSTHYNNVINDIATGLSTCLTKDGQQTATANIPFGGFRATNVGITGIAGSVGTPAINVSDSGTGLYRSAASELAVTVAGTQRARFDSTGLIVTGAASVSTTLTATTSVVTPLSQSAAATTYLFGSDATGGDWAVNTVTKHLVPTTDNLRNIGGPANRILSVFASAVDSGVAGSLLLKTNSGTSQFEVAHTTNSVNRISVSGAIATGTPFFSALGSDTDVGMQFFVKGAGQFDFRNITGAGQFSILHTASATRNITVTGSNGGNPTLGVTAGSLAITPAVIMASSLVWGTGVANFGTITKRKTADESVTSSVTLQNDDHLTFAIAANEEWVASFEVSCGANLTATGIAFAVTVPSGATLQAYGQVFGDGGNNAGGQTQTSGAAILGFTPGTTINGILMVRVWVLNGATPGSVTLQWAQNTNSGTALTFRKGSSLYAVRIA